MTSGVLTSSFWQISWRCHYVVVVIGHPWKGGIAKILLSLQYRLATKKNANILTLIRSHEQKRSTWSFLLYYAGQKCLIGPLSRAQHRGSSDFVIGNLPEVTSFRRISEYAFCRLRSTILRGWSCHSIPVSKRRKTVSSTASRNFRMIQAHPSSLKDQQRSEKMASFRDFKIYLLFLLLTKFHRSGKCGNLSSRNNDFTVFFSHVSF